MLHVVYRYICKRTECKTLLHKSSLFFFDVIILARLSVRCCDRLLYGIERQNERM